MGEDGNDAVGWLVIVGLVLLAVALLTDSDSDSKPAASKPAVTGPPWEKRVEIARKLLKYCIDNAETGEEYYQEAERRLATGMGFIADKSIERACVYGHWRALLYLAVIRAINRKPDEAMRAFDKAVVKVNPAGIEPDDFRPKMFGMALAWLEAHSWQVKVWEDSIGRGHPGLSGAQLRAKAIEAIIETIPPLKP
ncbi:hypothetical protein AB0H63_23470 [Micromonospora echinospora]|uniref:hypothetical protein n=1 Tax=Micromonospora echinospora TaxID=1877 RepID=UPI0034061A96